MIPDSFFQVALEKLNAMMENVFKLYVLFF